MTPIEFDMAMNDLAEAFPRAKYSASQRRTIFEKCEWMPYFSFKRIVNNFTLGARYAPTPKDFIDAAYKERQHHGFGKEEAPRKPIVCSYCNDGGVCEVMHKESGEEFFARCGCTLGEYSIHRELKRFEWTGADPAYLVHKMQGERAERWKPVAFNPSKAKESLEALADIWFAKVKRSRAHWAALELGDDGGAA